jgi:carboxypeptidase T
VPDNLDALTYTAKVARTPYLTPAGPDVLHASVTPEAALAGRIIRLTASIDDTRYSARSDAEPTQNILAAEYYLDVPPWVTGVSSLPNAMRAQDGAFDAAEELVEANFSTLGLDDGSHTLFVRGQDGAGNWGPFSAVAFEINAAALTYLPFVAQD